MELTDQKIIKRFRNLFLKKKNSINKIEFLKERYEAEGKLFHKIFLHSGIIYNLNLTEIGELIEFVDSLKFDISMEMKEDLSFLRYLLEKEFMYAQEIERYVEDNLKTIRIEDTLNFLEYVKFNFIINGVSIDGEKYVSSITNSQYNHLLDSFPGIVECIRKYNIQNANKKVRKPNIVCKNLYQLVARRNSIRSLMNSVMMGLEKPRKIEKYVQGDRDFGTIYYMSSRPTYWPLLEIHRDLNFNYYSELELKTQNSLAEKTGYMASFNNGDMIKFDMYKGLEWLLEKEVLREYKLISPMYGSVYNSFIYNNSEYKISDLLNVYKALKRYIYKNNDLWMDNFKNNGDICSVKVIGERALIRMLGLNYTEIDLVRLLSFDIKGNENSKLLNYKPLIRSGSVYYLMSTWLEYVSVGRAIDKVLSDYKNVEVKLEDQGEKGRLFENTVENFFRDCNISFFRLKKDDDNDIPEIDGMFILDEVLFVFEAKATIKPETPMEAYNHLNSKLVLARDQLDTRLEVLKDKEKVKIIKEKIGHDISKYKIVPFVLLSHHYFNGYNELFNSLKDTYYPIIDFLSLKEIIKKRKVQIWKYDEKNAYYKRSALQLSRGKDLEVYMYNQIDGLLSYEKPTFQLLEESILFSISKPIKTRRKIDLID